MVLVGFRGLVESQGMSRVLRALRRRRYGLTQIVVVVASVQAYEGFRRVLDPDWPAAMANARRIESLERWAHIAWEQSLQNALLGLPELVHAANLFYFVGHFLLTGVFFVWLYRRSRPDFRLFRDAFLAATAIALFIHWQFPTAPPRLADIGLLDTLRQFSGIDIGSTHASSYYNPVAAVPSLHAAYAVGVGIGLVRLAGMRATQILGIVYPAAVVWTIVVTGNHFIFDAVAGVAVLGVGFGVARVARAARDSGAKQGGILAAATRGGAVR
jgi:PAP2 superfamily protein